MRITKKQEEDFDKVRKFLQLKYRNREKHAHELLDIYFSKQTIDRILDENYNNTFDSTTKLRLSFLYSANDGKSIYPQISELIQQPLEDTQKIVNYYAGKYYYFRYFGENGDKDLRYVKGSIEIYEDNGIPLFKHRSYAWKKEQPEHTGVVFLSGYTIYMLGFRSGVIRLSATRIEQEDDKFMHGILLSMADASLPFPFGARFIMVSSAHEDEINKLSSGLNSENYLDVPCAGSGYFNELAISRAYFFRGIPNKDKKSG